MPYKSTNSWGAAIDAAYKYGPGLYQAAKAGLGLYKSYKSSTSRSSKRFAKSRSSGGRIKAYSTKSKRYGARARRIFKRGGVRRRRPVSNLTRQMLLDTLTVSNFYTGEVADALTLTKSDTTWGLKQLVWSFNTSGGSGNYKSNPWGAQDPDLLKAIAFKITTATNPSIKFFIKDFSVQHRITNSSNQIMRITAYKCYTRRDLPELSPYKDSIQDILGQGYATTGQDSANPNSANNFLWSDIATPYKSPLFCQCFKIIQTKNITVAPGQVARFSLRQKGFAVNPNVFLNIQSGQTYSTAAQVVNWRKGECFWVFRAVPDQLSVSVADVNKVANDVNKILMATRYTYEYKFIQQTQRVTTVTAPTGVNTSLTGINLINTLSATSANLVNA